MQTTIAELRAAILSTVSMTGTKALVADTTIKVTGDDRVLLSFFEDDECTAGFQVTLHPDGRATVLDIGG